MDKRDRFGFRLTKGEKLLLARLAEFEGGLSQAALIRRLIHQSAQAHGLMAIDQEQKYKKNTNTEWVGEEVNCDID